MEEVNHAQLQIIHQQKEVIQNIRRKQHEYKNNIENINALLLDQDVEKARYFTNELLGKSIHLDQEIRKHANFVQLLLDYKMQEAERKHIKIAQEVMVCHDIPVNEYDVAIVINNAMNNAMEACEKLPVKNRYIRCVVNVKMNYLNFYFENSYSGKIRKRNGRLVTSKGNKKEHGFGMQNLEEIIRKYDGFMSHGTGENMFWLKCSLRISKKKSA